ncbi:MAG: hypothetical protein EBT79_10820 [Actinobacteria bacterium]|nr:hypothetical protein [Actinomycetota bacterium]NBR67744.1 hypothetical protein [Actinomycetota bacterium]
MPIGRLNNAIGTGAYVTVPGASGQASGPVATGEAVAITDVGIVPCSVTQYGASFVGFSLADAATGKPVAVTSMRGSIVEPLTEDGGPMTPNLPVFLSMTPGRVSQAPPPVTTGLMVLKVGVAISPTQMVLLTDFRVLR